jgi:all-trans-retinol 13,14-reductase
MLRPPARLLGAMLPSEMRDRFMTQYRDRRPSISLWTISLGLSRRSHDFGVRHYSVTVLPVWMTALTDYRQAGAFLDRGRMGRGSQAPHASS